MDSGQAYVSQIREHRNIRGREGQGGGRDGGRVYGCVGGQRNTNELKSNKGGGHDEGQQEERGHGKGG